MKDHSAVFSHTVQVTHRGFEGILLLDTLIVVHSIKVKSGETVGRTWKAHQSPRMFSQCSVNEYIVQPSVT